MTAAGYTIIACQKKDLRKFVFGQSMRPFVRTRRCSYLQLCGVSGWGNCRSMPQWNLTQVTEWQTKLLRGRCLSFWLAGGINNTHLYGTFPRKLNATAGLGSPIRKSKEFTGFLVLCF